LKPLAGLRSVLVMASTCAAFAGCAGIQKLDPSGAPAAHGAASLAKSSSPGFAVLHQFAGVPDGIHPYGGAYVDRSGRVFGTTEQGGAHACGMLFELTPQGSSYVETDVRSFKPKIDGCAPSDNPIEDGRGNLFVTVGEGGKHERSGTVVKFSPSGSGFSESAVYSLGLAGNGVFPDGPLVKRGSQLFGTTSQGGAYGYGSIFEISASLQSETPLFSFAAASGETPFAGLAVDASGALYGTTYQGGAYGYGTVFKFVPQGNSGTETVILNFNLTDGSGPWGGVLVDKDGSIYGTTTGSSTDSGVVYRLTPVAGGYTETVLQHVGQMFGGLAEINDNLYGATFSGGNSSPDCDDSCGTIFEISKTGTGFSIVHTFSGSDGGNPYSTLATDGRALYGTTAYGGSYADGVVFKLVP
jgi:uncharacterized repeat protein (TIGR03803 family)